MAALDSEKDVSDWLLTEPETIQNAVAVRLAMRALPALGFMDSTSAERVSIRILRTLISSASLSSRPGRDLRRATRTASEQLAISKLTTSSAVFSAAKSTSLAAECARTDTPIARASLAASCAKWSASSSARSIRITTGAISDIAEENAARESVYAALTRDMSAKATMASPSDLHSAPLWHANVLPTGFKQGANQLFSFWTRNPEAWSFWRDWYQGFLDGKPFDWDLQREVALIPDADWEKGPKHVAAITEEIRKRYDLKARISELERELVSASASRFGIGGNNPPETIEDAPAITREFTLIWEPLQALKTEAAAEAPDASRIRAAISKLVAALAACGKWAGGKLDAAAAEYAKSIGKWGGAGTTAWLTLNNDKVFQVIDAAKGWLAVML